MSTPSSSLGGVFADLIKRYSKQHEQQKASPTDQRRALQLLEDHHPWEALDDTVLSIIDQTHAALLGILGLTAPPPGGAVRVVGYLVDAAADSPPTPVLRVVVEASSRHCRTSLIHRLDSEWWDRPGDAWHIPWRDPRRCRSSQHSRRRASVGTAPGRVLLARAADDDGGGDHHGVEGVVSQVAVLGVLETMRSRLDAAIQVEAGMARTTTSGCGSHGKTRDCNLARFAMEGMRQQLDVGAAMRRFRHRRQYYRRARDRMLFGHRRRAAEMDVDQVDEAEVLKLKAMHV